jgi:hypothetical protein
MCVEREVRKGLEVKRNEMQGKGCKAEGWGREEEGGGERDGVKRSRKVRRVPR